MACLIGGSRRITPSTAAIARWLASARLSKIRFCSMPRSIAISTVRCTEFDRRDHALRPRLEPQALRGSRYARRPRSPGTASSSTRPCAAWDGAGRWPRPASSPPPGRRVTHLPQPLQRLSSTAGRKLVVWTGWRTPNWRAAIIASQQQPQQLQMKLTLARRSRQTAPGRGRTPAAAGPAPRHVHLAGIAVAYERCRRCR